VDVVGCLSGVPFLVGLTPAALTELAAYTRIVSFDAGETIVEMETGSPLFVVLDGHVRIVGPDSDDDLAPTILGPGECFGERAVLNAEPRGDTVQATEDTRLLMLEQQAFRELVARVPSVAVQIIENLSLRIGRSEELIRDLSDTAMRDVLTGILNRRAYEERLKEEVERSLRYSEHLSLIITDLDHFKTINDTYGHSTGDIVLHWVGRLLTEHTRSPDTPFRIGGEEFAVLAPATNVEVAHHVAQRLVDIVAEARPPLDFELKITMSAGFACCPVNRNSASGLFSQADQALLQAKAEGRNRVCGPPAQAVTQTPDPAAGEGDEAGP
jgi:diguanylate cyclase (GGDEF)-like protein